MNMAAVSSEVSFAASSKLRTPGQRCRIKLRTNNISVQEKVDPIYGNLPELPDWRKCQHISAPGWQDSDYLSLGPDFSPYQFWSELADLGFDEEGGCELPDFPEMDADLDIWPRIDDDVLKFEDAEDFGEELKDLEVEKEMSSMKWMDFLNPCSFVSFDDWNPQMIPVPLGSEEPESEIVNLESNKESSIIPLSSAQLLPDDHAEIISSGDCMKVKKASTSARSQKKTRLNPAVAWSSFGASFKLKKISDDLQEIFCYENLECNEVLSDSDSEAESVEIFREKPSSRRPKKKIGGPINRNHLPEQAVNTMKTWMDKHMSNPYATKEEKLELVKHSGLTMHQVENWLSNTRYRLKIQKARSAAEQYEQVTGSSPARKTLVARNKRKLFFPW